MIRGVGVDVVDVWRIDRALQRHGDRFARRVFTEGEIAYCASARAAGQRYAARFAAKEAAAKALGTGFGAEVRLRDIEVVKDAAGAPALRLHGGAEKLAASMGVRRIHVSLSHSLDHAVAVVVLEGEVPA
jgi:holo-[acyl-carrier protein] synthase